MKAIKLNLKKEVIYRTIRDMQLLYKMDCDGVLLFKGSIDDDWCESGLDLEEIAELELEEYSPKIDWGKVPRDADIFVRDKDFEEWRPAKFLMSKRALGYQSMYPFVAYYFNGDSCVNVSNFAEAKISGEIKKEWLK